jgi:uncharacterized protein YecE (DUF72 family)
VDCDSEFDEFVNTMDILGPKLGPMVFQFPLFDRWNFPKQDSFLAVLVPFLKKLPADHKFVIEIRNKKWLDARFADVLREHNVALALTDTSFMPRPWEMKEKFDLITADFAYVRWLGDRKGIEKQTTTWDKTVIDRTDDLKNWVEVFKSLVSNTRVLKIFAFSNNHYAGHGPATVKLFMDLWNRDKRNYLSYWTFSKVHCGIVLPSAFFLVITIFLPSSEIFLVREKVTFSFFLNTAS